ncbi:MAG: insulinase family protein [Ruminococcus sp.]|uniref:EF-P 5-aminopentanol modification-associated protein YfmF n=1 Tax=Ruminococcus sp. TaxID=41978 RepID=UPI0025DC70B1|nr:insulinase family protein [Ruminococcus sp.]MBR6996736.1 insulinase family protein [Ruminococcus sp.]
MIYKRSELGDNIGFTTIIDEKFKTCSLAVFFLTELSDDTAAVNTLATSILSTSSSRYRSYAALTEKLSELYGAGLGSAARKKGNAQILSLKASWLDSRYAIDGEDIGGEMRELFKDCLFSPNAENGAFDEDSFAIAKKDLLDRIDSELNQKRGYALSQAAKIAYRGEPAECTGYGSKEAALSATPEDAFRAYCELMKTAQIEIYYVTPREDDSFAEMFRSSFGSTERCPKAVKVRDHSPLKPEVETFSEEFDVSQCKAVMAFKTDSDDIYALKMLSLIYGELPFSKLFLNVREKMSLCYYCTSHSVSAKGSFFVDCGVERSNIEKAKAEIMAQLEEIKQGNITDMEMEGSLMALDNAVLQVGDTPSSYIGWYFDCFCDGETITPEEHFRRFTEVTRERIVEAAKSLKPDSIYLMLNKEVKG